MLVEEVVFGFCALRDERIRQKKGEGKRKTKRQRVLLECMYWCYKGMAWMATIGAALASSITYVKSKNKKK